MGIERMKNVPDPGNLVVPRFVYLRAGSFGESVDASGIDVRR
jgi:hypothetical protein